MFRIHQRVAEVDLPEGKSWPDVCKRSVAIYVFGYNSILTLRQMIAFTFRIPIVSFDLPAKDGMKLVSSPCDDATSDQFDPSICLDPETYCQIVNQSLSLACLETSVLELFGYEETTYLHLTEKEILSTVNEEILLR